MARILTVDDEPLICRQIARILSKYGHEVHQFYSGQDALEAMHKMEFDLALVDYHLPVMDGLEILHHLRERQPGCVRILVTGMLILIWQFRQSIEERSHGLSKNLSSTIA